jgi:hypothetical protein
MRARILVLTFWFCMAACAATAESVVRGSRQPAADPMDAVKKSIIEKALHLTPQQCEAFWPLYDAYQQRLRVILDRRFELTRYFTEKQDALSEEEARRVVDAYLDLETERLSLRRSAMASFGEVLPAQALFNFLQLEMKVESAFGQDFDGYLPDAR